MPTRSSLCSQQKVHQINQWSALGTFAGPKGVGLIFSAQPLPGVFFGFFILFPLCKQLRHYFQTWNTGSYLSVYRFLIQYQRPTMVSVSTAAALGGGLFMWLAKWRYNLQMYGFLVLAFLLIAV